jgi:hypothetical protein
MPSSRYTESTSRPLVSFSEAVETAFRNAIDLASGGSEVGIVREGAVQVGALSVREMLGIIATIGAARARAVTLIAARSTSSPWMQKSTTAAEDHPASDTNDGEWVWVPHGGDESRTTSRAKPLLVRHEGDGHGEGRVRPDDDDAFVDALAARISEKLTGLLDNGREDPILLDYTRAAERLCTTVAALKARVQRGQMPEGSVVRMGKRVMFKTEALRRAQPSRRKAR